MNSSSVSVMLVDDHAVVRAGYKRFIELDPLLKVIAEASSGEEAYTFLESNPVDVIIMDLSMPGQGGFETLRRLLNRFPQQKILIFTMHENASIANQALTLGASGYLTKSMEPDLIVQAIHDVMSGGTPIAKAIAEGLKDLTENRLPHMELLPREFEIFICLKIHTRLWF
jgi:DNA-binding NarL/FixJ family response regulator